MQVQKRMKKKNDAENENWRPPLFFVFVFSKILILILIVVCKEPYPPPLGFDSDSKSIPRLFYPILRSILSKFNTSQISKH